MGTTRSGAGMTKRRPHLVVLAGPNGAGKSTAAPALLRGRLGVMEFVNADTIARGLSAFSLESAALQLTRRLNMAENELDPIDHAFAEGAPIDQALEEAVREALKLHKQAGNPIAEWRNGEVHWIKPEEIEITDEG